MKKILNKLEKIGENPYVFCLILAVLLNIGIEMLSRKSLNAVLVYIENRPYPFFYNSLLIAVTLSVSLLTKRRVFAFSFLSLIWLGLGLINSILLVFRTTPFTAVDLLLIKSAYSIMGTYLTPFQTILLLLLLIAACAAILLLWWKAPKRKERISYRAVIFYMLLLFGIERGCMSGGLKMGLLAENFGNIGIAYMQYGFAYCFGNSLLNTGIDKPNDYSSEIVDEIIAEVGQPIYHAGKEEGESDAVGSSLEKGLDIPNIIYLQLESFFDPTYVKNVSFSQDPLPFFRTLKEAYTSGFLNVPSVGAGTANTEFEIISGMNLDFFGPGEYPYKTILKETTCESIAYNMKELGFTAHVIHNNDGAFYDRNQVFSQLGFDGFTSVEYMEVEEYTPMGWAKDKVLTGEIEEVLRGSDTRDIIYTISVQGHGSYPSGMGSEDDKISVEGFESQELNESFCYYTNQIYEMDLFLRELTAMLEVFPEKTLLILYGDHLPGFGLEDSDLINENIYQTEYVIWTNFKMEKKDRDLEAYQLSAYVMELLGLHNGILTKYHQAFAQEEAYLEDLKLLEYDMLYGELVVYGGVNPHEVTDLHMGHKEILVTGTEPDGKEKTLIRGQNFTKNSQVFVNEKLVTTAFLSSECLEIKKGLTEGDEITVWQIGKDNARLSSTEIFLYMPQEVKQ